MHTSTRLTRFFPKKQVGVKQNRGSGVIWGLPHYLTCLVASMEARFFFHGGGQLRVICGHEMNFRVVHAGHVL